MTSRAVRSVFTKYDGSLHWHQTLDHLGEDEHGIWLGAPAGRTAQRGTEPPIVFAAPFVMLVPPDRWWTAAFNGPPARAEIYCDIATPATWTSAGEVTMIDLDLDVVRVREDQQVLLLDEDEFAEHQVRYGYAPEVISAAERSAAWLLAAVRSRAEPFGSHYQTWLDLVR